MKLSHLLFGRTILLGGIPVGLCLAAASTGYSAVIVASSIQAAPYTLSVPNGAIVELNKVGTPGVTRSGDTVYGGAANTQNLADGDMATGGSVIGQPIVNVGGTTQITYSFATPVTIYSIETFTTGTDVKYINQNYRLTYKTVATPVFSTLTTVAYVPGAAGNTKVSITNDQSATLLSDVTAVQFIFRDVGTGGDPTTIPQAGWVKYSELSINGVVPEPTSLAVMGLAGLGLLSRRRAVTAA